MYLLTMLSLRRLLLLTATAACLVGLSACGGGTDATEVTSSADAAEVTAASTADQDDGDQDDGDEDHGDEDHGDEDHDDEDHDDDHDDEDHGDEDHDDEDHDDEDHDDEDHDDGIAGGFDAHVHGEAELFIGLGGDEVLIDFVSPAINIIGFEYEPVTDEDKEFAARRTNVLSRADLLVFNAEAGCELAEQAESVLEFDGSHAEVAATWVYACDNPDQVSELDATALFEEFPELLDVDAQWATESQQSAAELSPSSTVLRFG